MWTPRGRVLDAALLDALRRRQDLELVIAESVYTAVGSVLKVVREAAAGMTPVLLLVEPRLLAGASEAVAAVRQAGEERGRRVPVWVYERRSRAYVRALRSGEESAWSPALAAVQHEPKPAKTGARPAGSAAGPKGSAARGQAAGDLAARLMESAAPMMGSEGWREGRPRLRLAIDPPSEAVGEAPVEAHGEESAAEDRGDGKGTSENAMRDASCSVPDREVGQARVTGMTLTDEELSMLLAKRPERGQDSR